MIMTNTMLMIIMIYYDGVDDHERGSHDVTLSHSVFDQDEDGEEDDEIMKTTILHFSKFQLWI